MLFCGKVRVTYEFREIGAVANHFKDALSHNESPGQDLLLRLLLDYLLHHSLQIFHVVVLVPADIASGGLEAFADRVIDHLIGHDHISTFAKSRDNARNS